MKNLKSSNDPEATIAVTGLFSFSGKQIRKPEIKLFKNVSAYVYNFGNTNQLLIAGFHFDNTSKKLQHILVVFTPDMRNPLKNFTYDLVDVKPR